MEKNFLQHFHGQSLAGEVLRGVAMGRVIQHIPQHQNFAYIEECCLDGDAAGVQRAFLCAAEKDDICEQCAGGVLVMGQQDDFAPAALAVRSVSIMSRVAPE